MSQTNKYNKYFEEKRKKMKEFQDKLNETLDKKHIAEVFQMALEVGFFGTLDANKKLNLRFQEGGYNFTLSRTPIDVNAIIQRMGLINPINPVKQRTSVVKATDKFGRRRFV